MMNSCASAGNSPQATSGIDQPGTQPTDQGQLTNHRQTKTLTVFAAASLTDAFREIANEFEAHHPGVRVSLSFAGSQVLRTQVEQGATADVFASADQKSMDLLSGEGLINRETDHDFATNRLVVILPPGNSAGVHTLKDLARPGLKIILADISVPAGQYAQEVLTNLSGDPDYGADFLSNVLRNVVSYETDVRQVVSKVELGEADAGIVYISDATANPNLVSIPIPDKFNVIAEYPIGILRGAPNPDWAKAFIDYVVSPAGQAILQKWGFSPGK